MPRDRTSRARRRSQREQGLAQLPRREIVNRYRPIEVLTEDQVEAIHLASLQILEDIGMDFLHPEALDILGTAGAEVESGTQRVRIDRELLLEKVALAPSRFTLHARNPAHHVAIGDSNIAFCTVASAPNASDIAGGRRTGNFDDYRNFIRLGQV